MPSEPYRAGEGTYRPVHFTVRLLHARPTPRSSITHVRDQDHHLSRHCFAGMTGTPS